MNTRKNLAAELNAASHSTFACRRIGLPRVRSFFLLVHYAESRQKDRVSPAERVIDRTRS
jgi:hypothetical protein